MPIQTPLVVKPALDTKGEPVEAIQPESQTKEAYDIYFELHPGAINEYTFVNGTYEYKED